MEFLERTDGSSRNDGINDTTYYMLFGDINCLPEEEFGEYANVKA